MCSSFSWQPVIKRWGSGLFERNSVTVGGCKGKQDPRPRRVWLAGMVCPSGVNWLDISVGLSLSNTSTVLAPGHPAIKADISPRYQWMGDERSSPFCHAADMGRCCVLKARRNAELLLMTHGCNATSIPEALSLEWMVVIHFCRIGEQEVFSVPTLVQGPSFVSTELLFYSRKSSLLAGEINLYIVKMRAHAPCLCTKVTAILYWKITTQISAHQCLSVDKVWNTLSLNNLFWSL